jgi:hypothetical protein
VQNQTVLDKPEVNNDNLPAQDGEITLDEAQEQHTIKEYQVPQPTDEMTLDDAQSLHAQPEEKERSIHDALTQAFTFTPKSMFNLITGIGGTITSTAMGMKSPLEVMEPEAVERGRQIIGLAGATATGGYALPALFTAEGAVSPLLEKYAKGENLTPEEMAHEATLGTIDKIGNLLGNTPNAPGFARAMLTAFNNEENPNVFGLKLKTPEQKKAVAQLVAAGAYLATMPSVLRAGFESAADIAKEGAERVGAIPQIAKERGLYNENVRILTEQLQSKNPEMTPETAKGLAEYLSGKRMAGKPDVVMEQVIDNPDLLKNAMDTFEQKTGQQLTIPKDLKTYEINAQEPQGEAKEPWQMTKAEYEASQQPGVDLKGKQGIIKAKDEFKVGDVLDPQGNTNMVGNVKITGIEGNTLKFTDSEGTEFSGMARSQVRKLIEGGSWKKGETGKIMAVRTGDIDKEGAYFSTEGSSTYYDPEGGAKKYEISNAKIATSGTPQMREILEKAKEVASPEELKRINSALEKDKNTDNFVDYRLFDEVPAIKETAEKMGYHGVKVWENDDIASPSSIFLWDTSKAKLSTPKEGTTQPSVPRNSHYNIVKKALEEGKNVPREVLKDYPELAKLFVKKSTAQRGITQSRRINRVMKERIKPDISGITPIQRQIDAMSDRQSKVDMAETELEQIEDIHKSLIHKIKKYTSTGVNKGTKFLAEELKGIPSIYITTDSTGMTPDEVMENLRDKGIEIQDESVLKEYLRNLAEQRKSLKETIENFKPQLVTKRETTLLSDKIKAAEQGIREGKLQTKDEIKAVQTELIDMIEQSKLDPEDRAKFLRTLKNIQTKAQLIKAFPELTERLITIKDKTNRSELIADLRELFAKKPTKGLPLAYKDLLEDIKSKIHLKQRTEKQKAGLESTRNFVARMAEEGEDINIPQSQLDLLDKKSVDELSTDELQDLKNTIERLYHLGGLKDKLLTTQQDRKFDEITKEGVDTITKGTGLTEESTLIKALREQNKNLAKKSLEAVKNYLIINRRPEALINVLDNFEDGVNTKTLFNPLWESEKNKLVESDRVLTKIKNILKDLDLHNITSKKYDIGRFKGMTKDNALFIYANSFNDSNLAHLYGSGITDEDIKAITNFLTPEEKQNAMGMFKFYDEDQYPAIDKVYSRLEGVHLSKEYSYFPIDRLEDISYQKELEQNILEANYIRRAGVAKGFSKERVTSDKGFSEFSFIGTILRNLQKVEQYKAYAEAVRDVNKYLNNPEIKNAIKQKYGDKYLDVLNKWLKDNAYGGDKQTLDFINNMSKWLRTNWATSALGLNIVSMLKHPMSFIQGAEMAGKGDTLGALAKFIIHPFEMIKSTEAKSPLLKFRAFSQEREMREILSQRSISQQLGKVTGYQKIREWSMLPLQISDKVLVTTVWQGAYSGAIKDGLSEQDSIDFADKVIRRVVPMGAQLHLPEAFRGGPFQKFFTLFRNQPNQNFNLITDTILKSKEGKIGKPEAASNLLFYLLIPAFVIGWINRRRLQEGAGEYAKDIVNQACGGLVFWGSLAEAWASKGFRGENPLDTLLKDTYATATADTGKKRLKAGVKLLGETTGLPVTGVKRILTGNLMGTKQNGLANR